MKKFKTRIKAFGIIIASLLLAEIAHAGRFNLNHRLIARNLESFAL